MTGPEPEPFEIYRRTWLFVAIMATAICLAVAFGWLAYDRSDLILAVVTVELIGVAMLFLPSLRDIGTPLLVADSQGLRLQSTEGWVGLLWSEIDQIQLDRSGWLRGRQLLVSAVDSPEAYRVPLGLAAAVNPGAVTSELATRRSAAAY